MTIRRWLIPALLAASAASASAQQNASPHAAFVYPAGGQRGASFVVTVGGQFLDGAAQAVFAGDGVKAEILSFQKPLPGKDLEDLRKRLTDLEQSHANAPRPPAPATAPTQQTNANAAKPAPSQTNPTNSAAASAKDGQKPPEPRSNGAPVAAPTQQANADAAKPPVAPAKLANAAKPGLVQTNTTNSAVAAAKDGQKPPEPRPNAAPVAAPTQQANADATKPPVAPAKVANAAPLAPQTGPKAAKPAPVQATTNNSAAAAAKDGQKPPEPPRAPAPWTPEDKLLAADLRRQIEQSVRMSSTPALSQSISLKVTIASNAALGNHELRLLTAKGLTNPLVFEADRLPEITRGYQFVQRALAAGGGLPLNPQAHADAAQPPQTI